MLVEKFAELHVTRVVRYLALAKKSLESAEQLGRLQWKNAQAILEKNTAIVKAMGETNDITELLELSNQLAEFNVEKAWAYPLTIYEQTAQIQTEFGRLIEESMVVYGDTISRAMNTEARTEISAAILSSANAVSNRFDKNHQAAEAALNGASKQQPKTAATN